MENVLKMKKVITKKRKNSKDKYLEVLISFQIELKEINYNLTQLNIKLDGLNGLIEMDSLRRSIKE